MAETMNHSIKPADSASITLIKWLLPLMIYFLIVRTPNDTDMWWHLRAGQEMVSQRTILTTDVFSYTRVGAQWTNAFWLADICLFGLYRYGGFLSLAFTAAVIMSVTMLIVLKQSPGPIQMTIGLILIGSLGISPFGGVRPQLFSFLLLSFLGYFLMLYRQRKIQPWLLIILFIFWANVHGGFVWGFLLLMAVITGEILNHLTLTTEALPWKDIGNLSLWSLLAGLSTVVNPNGINLWKLPFYTVHVSLTSISEWASPDFHRFDMHPMLWLIFLLFIGLGFSKKIPDWVDILKFVGFAYMAFVSQRSIGPFLVVAIPIVARYLNLAWVEQGPKALIVRPIFNPQHLNRSISQRSAWIINTFIFLVFAIMAIWRTYWVANPTLVMDDFPGRAITWIKEHKPTGPIFNSYNWGGYIAWSLPDYPVFIDGRADLYGDELMNGWWDVVSGSEKGLRLLDQWKIRLVLLEPGWPLLQKLPALGWQLLYSDNQSTIMGR